MLILSRKAGESLVIGQDVVVTVLEIRNKQIRIGISAPGDVEVHREEVFLRINEERHQGESPGSNSARPAKRCHNQHNASRHIVEERL